MHSVEIVASWVLLEVPKYLVYLTRYPCNLRLFCCLTSNPGISSIGGLSQATRMYIHVDLVGPDSVGFPHIFQLFNIIQRLQSQDPAGLKYSENVACWYDFVANNCVAGVEGSRNAREFPRRNERFKNNPSFPLKLFL